MNYQDYSLILLFICCDLGYGCPNFYKNGTARGVYYPKLGVLRGVPFMGLALGHGQYW